MSFEVEFHERWVKPFYQRLLNGRFSELLYSAEPPYVPSPLGIEFRKAIAVIEPADCHQLFEEGGWRARMVGSWYAALRRWPQFVDVIGTRLIESDFPYAGRGYCSALATFCDERSSSYLRRYLDTWLPQTHEHFDQHWALPALHWIDERLDTRYAEPYLVPGGLWDRWTAGPQQGRQLGPDCYTAAKRAFDTKLSLALAAFSA